MSTEQNKTIVRRFLEEIINRENPAALNELVAADFVWHGGSVGEVRGLETFKQFLTPFFTAFPELHAATDDLIGEGDQVVARYSWRGAQHGEFMGIPPTDKRVTVTGISIYRVAGGKIVEEWWQEDMLGLMQQLGAVPTPEHAGS
jgi:steroid delta-isomerase-like uncharacterized protein